MMNGKIAGTALLSMVLVGGLIPTRAMAGASLHMADALRTMDLQVTAAVGTKHLLSGPEVEKFPLRPLARKMTPDSNDTLSVYVQSLTKNAELVFQYLEAQKVLRQAQELAKKEAALAPKIVANVAVASGSDNPDIPGMMNELSDPYSPVTRAKAHLAVLSELIEQNYLLVQGDGLMLRTFALQEGVDFIDLRK